MSNVKSTDADTVDGQHAADIGRSDGEIKSVINGDGDHGSTASHDYRSDGEIESVINGDGDHGSTASHDYRTPAQEAEVALAHQVVLGGGL